MTRNRHRFVRIYCEYFPTEVKKFQDRTEVPVVCPFHDDNAPSASINLDKGMFYCQVCKEDRIDDIEFVRRMMEIESGEPVSFTEAKAHADRIAGGIPRNESERKAAFEADQKTDCGVDGCNRLDLKEVTKYERMLEGTKKAQDFLRDKRGYTDETIKRFRLGFEVGDPNRIRVPIFSPDGELLNFRRYAMEAIADKGRKMISVTDHGDLYLFPISNIHADEIILCEGEMDTMLACQMGFNAMTVTGGAGNWADWMTPLFKDKKVYLAYDVDNTGRVGARTVAKQLITVAAEVKILHIPVRDIPNGDFTDWVLKQGATADDVTKLINETIPMMIHVEKEQEDIEYAKVHLSEATESQYQNKPIEFNVIVAGKHTAPFTVAKQIRVRCNADGKKCETCGMASGDELFTIGSTDRVVLKLIDCSDKTKKSVVKEIADINMNCCNFDYEEIGMQNIEEVQLIPELDFSSEDREHVLRRAFTVGEQIKANCSYCMKGITTSDPTSQEVTHIMDNIEPTQDSISMFKMTPETYERLKIFQGDDVEAKWKEIMDDLCHNVTQIFGREDLHIGADLVYHSVLAFDFQNKRENRGWVETLFMGDTRTGKSETVQRLVNHYKLGEFCTGENSSFAGLVGGAQQLKDHWIITWGKIPLNDRRLVVIDEASGLDTRAIEIMSGIRSSGIAEQNKIKSEKTHARTRLIWISNDRQGAGLSTYGYGLNAILELIGKTEDVARFEFVVTAANGEVPMDVINTKIEDRPNVEHKFTSELCRTLVLWAWSRKPENIEFTKEAVNTIFELAEKQGRFYTSKVPLVQGANQRMKLARMAVACAARLFNTDESGEKVLVESKHVRFVYNYLNQIYRKPSLGYADMSMIDIEANKFAEEKKGEITKLLNQSPLLADVFLPSDIIVAKDLEDMLDLERNEARGYIKILSKNKMIEKYKHGYKKTQAFINILKDWKQAHQNQIMEDML